MAEAHNTPQTRDTKPGGGAEKAPGAKGAGVNPTMGAPLSPTGPNETEDGIIKQAGPEFPGEDQIGLVGGNPEESLQSTPPLEEEEGAPAATQGAARKTPEKK